MSNKQETIADIIAEMRDLGKLDDESSDKIPRRLMGLGLRTYADRIEAAQKREVGNGAKMREALELCVKQMSDAICNKDFGDDVVYLVGCMKTCIEYMKAALALPPRNCDVGTVDEQTERFVDFTRLVFQSEVVRCALNWAQMPYEEGGEQ